MRVLTLVMFLVTLTMSSPLPQTGFSVNDPNSIDKLIVEQRLGKDNRYELLQEINDTIVVNEAKLKLNDGEWSRVKFQWQTPPAFKLHFQPTDGSRQTSAVEYDVWFTNGYAEIYISETHLYKKLSLKDSEMLKDIIQ